MRLGSLARLALSVVGKYTSGGPAWKPLRRAVLDLVTGGEVLQLPPQGDTEGHLLGREGLGHLTAWEG